MTVRAIVPCAGDSRRMGRPKALIELDGATFLARIVAALRAGGVDEVCVVHGGAYSDAVRDHADTLGVTALHNPDPSEGPISSIRLAITSAPSAVETFLIHPSDIPGVTAQDVCALLSVREEFDAVIPSVNGRRGHPLLLTAEFAGEVRSLPSGSTMRNLLSRADVRIRYVESTNGELLKNVNTPEDLRDL